MVPTSAELNSGVFANELRSVETDGLEFSFVLSFVLFPISKLEPISTLLPVPDEFVDVAAVLVDIAQSVPLIEHPAEHV